MPKLSDIGAAAEAAADKEFAEAVSKYTTLEASEARDLFPQQQEKQEFISLLKAVNEASDDNDRKAKIVAGIGNFAGALVKITKKFTTGLG